MKNQNLKWVCHKPTPDGVMSFVQYAPCAAVLLLSQERMLRPGLPCPQSHTRDEADFLAVYPLDLTGEPINGGD